MEMMTDKEIEQILMEIIVAEMGLDREDIDDMDELRRDPEFQKAAKRLKERVQRLTN